MAKKVAVLLGGKSNEREVSLSTGAAVVEALQKLGHQTEAIDPADDLISALQSSKPDVVFNALHGTYGEDGCISGLLELLEIPYTHSGVKASAAAMDKPMAKILFKSLDIPIARDVVLTLPEILQGHHIATPYIIKPVAEGSSVGVCIINDTKDLENAKEIFNDEQLLLVEEFIAGRELTVAVLDGKALGCMEIIPHDGFYDYKNKYTAGRTEYKTLDSDLPICKRVMRHAESAHEVLGCRSVSRSDFRYDEDTNTLAILETNTHPGMTATSLTPKMAQAAGISFEELVQLLLDGAKCDYRAAS